MMLSFLDVIILSAVMGFSIYLSIPIVLRSGTGAEVLKLLNAGAIGILIFLLADIFSNATTVIYNGALYGYGSSPIADIIFILSFSAGFGILYIFENRSKEGLTASRAALLMALGIGFQNLTEGLVFGSTGALIGLSGAATVILLGFILQNMTEGFPISSPFLGNLKNRERQIIGLLLIGGVPDIIGGAFGYYFNLKLIGLLFDGLAMGTIMYVVLPMIKSLFSDRDRKLRNLAYIGIFTGFIIGFAVNLI
jgi:ZIP family zinc transporter